MDGNRIYWMPYFAAKVEALAGEIKYASALPENASSPEIESWEDYLGVVYPKLKTPLRPQAKPPECPYEMGWERITSRLESLAQAIEDMKTKRESVQERTNETREDRIKTFEAEIDDLWSKRKPLTMWELSEIGRCLRGSGPLVGRHYFYIRMGHIEENDEGAKRIITPLYRRVDNWLYRKIDDVIQEGTGIVGGKRRQFGWTWFSCHSMLYDCFFWDQTVFFLTKDDPDTKKFFDRVTTAYQYMPDFAKKPLKQRRQDFRLFGTNYWIISVKKACGILRKDAVGVPNARLRSGKANSVGQQAGETAGRIYVDEIGELPKLSDNIAILLDSMNASNSRRRSGAFIGLGTVGKMDRTGSDFKRVYKTAHAFGFHQVNLWAWMGLEPDAMGNERISPAEVQKDIEQRVRGYESVGNFDMAIQERQKHPMRESDLFLDDEREKVLPMAEIMQAQARLEEREIGCRREFGVFTADSQGNVSFLRQDIAPSIDPVLKPKSFGHNQWQILEPPVPGALPDTYVAGLDPVDLDKASSNFSSSRLGKTRLVQSDLACVIYKRVAEVGGRSHYPVAIYFGRNSDLEDNYWQVVYGLIYYGWIKVNVERNKGNTFFAFLKNNFVGGKHLLQLLATQIHALTATEKITEWGFDASPSWWDAITRVIRVFWKNSHENIWFDKVIEESLIFREDNTDVMVALGAALQLSNELDGREAIVRANGGNRRVKEDYESIKERYKKIYESRQGRESQFLGALPEEAGLEMSRLRQLYYQNVKK